MAGTVKRPTSVICKIKFNLADPDDLKVLQLLKAQKTPLARKVLLVKGALAYYDSLKREQSGNEALVDALDKISESLQKLTALQTTVPTAQQAPVSEPPVTMYEAPFPHEEFPQFTASAQEPVSGSGGDLLASLRQGFTI